jgi:siroheme synthase
VGTLGTIASLAQADGVEGPALLLVGEVVEHRVTSPPSTQAAPGEDDVLALGIGSRSPGRPGAPG